MESSFHLEIIKLLPQFENAIAVQDFRPFSPMNTDAKILAHTICKRFKKQIKMQNCKKPSARAFVWKTNKHSKENWKKANTPERLTNRGSCAVKLDFSEVFDSVDRSRLIKPLKGLSWWVFR